MYVHLELHLIECMSLRFIPFHLQDGKTSLHLACLTSDFEMVQILVEKGADLAAQDFVSYLLTYNA